MEVSSTKWRFVIQVESLALVLTTLFYATSASAQTRSTNAASQENTPIATGDKVYPTQLSGTVVHASGAVIAGAAVQIQSANDTVLRTAQTGNNGSFAVSGLRVGTYQLVISRSGFETKQISITIGNTGTLAPLRISLAVRSVNTTIEIQDRADNLVGIATPAGQ